MKQPWSFIKTMFWLIRATIQVYERFSLITELDMTSSIKLVSAILAVKHLASVAIFEDTNGGASHDGSEQ